MRDGSAAQKEGRESWGTLLRQLNTTRARNLGKQKATSWHPGGTIWLALPMTGPRRGTAVLVNQNHEVPAGGVPPSFAPTHQFQLDTPPSLAENGRAGEWSWGVRGDSPQTAPQV